MAQLLGVLEQGLIYAVLALGVYITFKILDFPDMTVDSTFPLGAAVTALMISNGIHPLLTLPASLLAGAAAGALTGVIHVKFHVRDLLSGIIMMTGLYSINLHIAGRANVQLFSFNTLFKNDFISGLPTGIQSYAPVILMALVALIVKLLMDAYLSTRSGFLLRATGDNPTLVASLAKDRPMRSSRSPAASCANISAISTSRWARAHWFWLSLPLSSARSSFAAFVSCAQQQPLFSVRFSTRAVWPLP